MNKAMNRAGRYLGSRQFLAVFACFSFLVVSFFGNFLGTGASDRWFTNFQNDSSLIIRQTAEYKNEVTYNGPIDPQSGIDHAPYGSQFGLQARIMAYFAPDNSDLIGYFHIMEMIMAIFVALVFTAFITKVVKLYGVKPAIATLIFICMSPWVVVYARNTYWVTFLMFLPFVFGFCLYPWFKRINKIWVFYSIVGVLFFLKLLNGYEHVTTMIISGLIPIIFYETAYGKAQKLIAFWRQAVIVFLVGCVAFTFAFTANITSLSSYYNSWPKALNAVMTRADTRSIDFMDYQAYVVDEIKETLPHTYKFVDKFYDLEKLEEGKGSPIKYMAFSALNYALLPAVSLPVIFRQPLGDFLQSIALVAIVAFFILRKLKNKKVINDKHALALQRSYWLGLVGALSWLVLMPGHAYPHVHLNAIVFYMPFLLICYIIFGILVTDFLKRYAKK